MATTTAVLVLLNRVYISLASFAMQLTSKEAHLEYQCNLDRQVRKDLPALVRVFKVDIWDSHVLLKFKLETNLATRDFLEWMILR
jgi:hypothetical protein